MHDRQYKRRKCDKLLRIEKVLVILTGVDTKNLKLFNHNLAGKITNLIHLLKSHSEDERVCKGANLRLFNFCQLRHPNDIGLHNFVQNEYRHLL